MTDPHDKNTPRRPAAFSIEPENEVQSQVAPEPARKPASFDTDVVLTPEEEDPFYEPAPDDAALAVAPAAPKRFSFAKIAVAAFGVLLSMAVGLWIDGLIEDLFTRADWLGYTAIAVLAIGILAVIAIVVREAAGMMRLAAVHAIRSEAELAAADTSPAKARTLVGRLCTLLAGKPQTARGRAALQATEGDIIDTLHLIDLAERELLGPLDRQARTLVLGAAKRVSVVTAVSPRALVDLLYVLYESARLVRGIADLYGARPGTLGLLRLMRDVVAHLAVTGSIAVGDGIVQQIVGHGLASRLSARLGEGVVNGMMTARIGIATMDLCRPLPFKALKKPGMSEFAGDLAPGSKTR